KDQKFQHFAGDGRTLPVGWCFMSGQCPKNAYPGTAVIAIQACLRLPQIERQQVTKLPEPLKNSQWKRATRLQRVDGCHVASYSLTFSPRLRRLRRRRGTPADPFLWLEWLGCHCCRRLGCRTTGFP